MSNKIYKVVISKRARDMLVSHVAFLAEASKTAALRLTSEFKTAALSLQSMPHRCPGLSFDGITHSVYHKLIFEGHYILIFQVVGDVVYVDYVVDARQDYEWLMK